MILQIKHLMKSKLWALLIFGIQGPTSCIGGNYITIGISNDDPDVVKGRAGPTLLRIITMLILISLLVQQIG
jgi:hypothetical protein